jgi:serine/threonine protein kinase
MLLYFRRLQGTTEADYEKEIVKTGYLSIKSLSDKNQSAKGKKRYTVLRNNGIVYAYRSPQDSAPTETYMLKNKSIVKIVKGKVGTLTITISPAVQLRFTADGQADAESWLEAISTTIKEMGLAEVWEIDSNEIKFEKSLTGDSVTVGKGASSTVMKGTYNGKPVAVKYYKQKDLNIEEFKNEVLLLQYVIARVYVNAMRVRGLTTRCSAVKHPSILPIYGITKSRDGTPAIVMPYVEKGTLFDVLHNGKLDSATYDWKLYLKIASDVARALEYLHTFKMNGVKQPIIHSDLKTANLLINNLSAKTAQSSVMLIGTYFFFSFF